MDTNKIKILIVEDSDSVARVMLHELDKNAYEIRHKVLTDLASFEISLEETWDVIIFDYSLSGFTGFDALKMCNQKGINIPFIIVSGNIGEEIAVKMINSGAKNYIMKGNLTRIFAAIKSEIADNVIRRENKEAEKVFLKSEDKFYSITDKTSDFISITDADGFITYASPASKVFFDFTSEEMCGHHFSEFIVESEVSESIELYDNQTIHSKIMRGFETKMKRKDGSFFTGELNSSGFLIDGSKNGSLVVIRDISERKLSADALQKIYEQLQATLNSLPILLFELDNDGRLVDFHIPHQNLPHIPQEMVTGKLLSDIFPADACHIINEALAEATLSGQHNGAQYSLENHEGLKWFELAISLKEDPQTHKNHFVVLVNDITEHKQFENDLIKAKEHAEESDRLKSSFLANMSHEIRTPMNGILGFADLLKEPNLTTEEQQEYINVIEKSGQRMLNIINDIIDISKIEANLVEVNRKFSNINEQTAFIYSFFLAQAELKGINLICQNGLANENAVIEIDKEKLYAILTNIVRNAFKFCDSGSIEFGYKLKGDFLEFFVKDTGIGIPDNRQNAIFDRFVQANIADARAFQGAGLGLSISKAYVEMMGGKIWVESKEGTGSIFYFTIPYITETNLKNHAKNESPSNQINVPVSYLNILIVEDDSISRLLLSKAVKIFSKKIFEATDGFEAVEVCKNNPNIDLVMMDIVMPKMNGHEATKKIREFNTNVIIIAQTANAFKSDKKAAKKAGCNDYISKPIDKERLSKLINKYFRNRINEQSEVPDLVCYEEGAYV